MPDWRSEIRERLDLPELQGLREERIIEEITVQLHDFYEEALGRMLPEIEAEQYAIDRIDWETLSDGLRLSERRRRRPRFAIWAESMAGRLRVRGGLWIWITDMGKDMMIALRQVRKNPGVTAAAVLCLAVAIGGGAVLYSMAVGTLLQPSTAENPDRIVRIYTRWEGGNEFSSVSLPDFEDIRREVGVFDRLVLATPMSMNLTIDDQNSRVWGSLVSGDFFECFGTEMELGRGFLPEEDRTDDTHPVVVVSYGFWQERFGSDPDIVGQQIQINRYPFTVIGVAGKGFYGDSVGMVMRLWIPVAMHTRAAPLLTDIHKRDNHLFRSIICHLRPGVSVGQAAEQVDMMRASLADRYPDLYTGKAFTVLPEKEASLDPMVRGGFVQFISFGSAIVALVLILSCANVAGLLLARTEGRRQEIGIRVALGAGRGRLMRSLLAESAVLAIIAGVLACIIAVVLNGASGSMTAPMDIPIAFGTGKAILWSDILFIFSATVAATVLISLTPAIHASRANIASALKSGSNMLSRRATFSRRILVIVQVAASFTLLVGGGLVLRGMEHMREIDPGFDAGNQLLLSLDLTVQGYSEEEGSAFFRDLKDRLSTLPGVEAVGMAFNIPLSLMSQTHVCDPEGYMIPEDERLQVMVNTVDEGYFTAMGIPILEGRSFGVFDDESAPPVIIVNEEFRDRYWSGESPIGKRVKHGDTWFEVVGMVPTGKYFSLSERSRPHYYYAFGQSYQGLMTIHIRSDSYPLALADAVRREVADLDQALPVDELSTMAGRISFSLMPYSIASGVMWMFGCIAMLLASIGLYGLVSYFVNRQTREIGVRMALGAVNSDVLRYVIGRGMRLTLVGLGIGLVCAAGVSVMAGATFPGIRAFEPLILGIPMLLLILIAFLASYFPARRAIRITPIDALKAE
ncbi:ABC transporter permease [Gemmatimonadota bacterium]